MTQPEAFAVVAIALVFAVAIVLHFRFTLRVEREAKRSLELLHARLKRLEAVTHFPHDAPRSSFDLDAANRKLTERAR